MTTKTRLIPFDYEKYKAGLKAITSNGLYATDLHLFKYNVFHNLFGLIEGRIISWYQNGTTYGNTKAHDLDLFLEEPIEEKTFYINVYRGGIEPYSYESLECAQQTVREGNNFYKGTLKVTYTDEDLIK